jgi:hypothetical protein
MVSGKQSGKRSNAGIGRLMPNAKTNRQGKRRQSLASNGHSVADVILFDVFKNALKSMGDE